MQSWRSHLFLKTGVLGLVALTLIPVLVILSSFLDPQPEIRRHLIEFVLPKLFVNSFWLLLGVSFGTLLFGVLLAWWVALYHFPGRRFFAWSLMLPLAFPAYVLAFTHIGFFDFTGPLQAILRDLFGSSAWFPKIRSTGGVIFVMSLALYPYVYLLAREAFASMGQRALEVGQSLGLNFRQSFFKVALPMARPWIIGGLSLALMETLADFGTVSIFNFDTFTTAIYKSWFALFSLSSASQLASILILFVFVLVWLELKSRGNRQYQQTGRGAVTQRIVLHGWKAYGVSAACALVLALAFVLPFVQLLLWSFEVYETDLDARYFGFVGQSLFLSAGAAFCVFVAALFLSYAQRRLPRLRLQVKIATLGYAVPGAVLAVGIFIPMAWLDNLAIDFLRQHFAIESSGILKGTIVVMMLAYSARFMAVGFQAIDSGMQRISKSQEECARTLKVTGLPLFTRLYLPLLQSGIFTALLMVFVDVMKEMPITLMTRPFGWDTLAIRIFEMTSEGEWERAALPSIAIVLVGLVPVIFLARSARD